MKKRDAVKHFGTKVAIADALGIKKSTLTDWGDIVPKGHAYVLFVITQGAIPLCPSDYEKKVIEQ